MMTKESFERRATDAGLKLTPGDSAGMFALFAGFESLKVRVRGAEIPCPAEPALVFSPSKTGH